MTREEYKTDLVGIEFEVVSKLWYYACSVVGDILYGAYYDEDNDLMVTNERTGRHDCVLYADIRAGLVVPVSGKFASKDMDTAFLEDLL